MSQFDFSSYFCTAFSTWKSNAKVIKISVMEEKNERKIDEIKLRLLDFAEKQHIPKYKFYEKISTPQSNFGGKSMESSLSSAKITEILIIFPELNPDWLLLGKGDMLRNPDDNSISKGGYPVGDDHMQSLIDILNRTLSEKDKQISQLLEIIKNFSSSEANGK